MTPVSRSFPQTPPSRKGGGIEVATPHKRSPSSRVVALVAGLTAVAGLATSVLVIALRRSSNRALARAQWSSAIMAVIDTTRENGWVETFQATRTQPLTAFDGRWKPIFGRLLVDSRLGAVIGHRGWEDGGDDYAFRATDVPTGSVEIVVDGWWDGIGAIGAEGAVQADPPHRLYEAGLWQGKLSIFYFVGPASTQYETLAQSAPLGISAGHYRIVFRMERIDSTWIMKATLRRPADGYAVLAEVSATDGRLGEGAQGIGVLRADRPPYITGIAVRALSP